MSRPCPTPVYGCMLIGLAVGIARPAMTEEPAALSSRVAAVRADHVAKLQALAAECERRGQKELAQRLREHCPQRDPWKLYVFLPSDAGGGEKPIGLADVPEAARLCAAQAGALMKLAGEAARRRQPSLASELVLEALHEDPHDKQARKLLGYVPSGSSWRTPFAVKQEAAGKVWHEQFGWLPAGHVERYEKGERFFRNRWLPAAEEAKLRADVRNGWIVETEHYSVTTNHSLEEGVRLAERLERLYAVWQNVFAGYGVSAAEFARRFEQASPHPASRRRHNVVEFRSRDEYSAALKSAQPKIEMTLGIYFDTLRTAYFFAGQDQDAGTLLHEATHQLFQETRPTAKQVGRRGNFWVVEAVACYMESLDDRGECVTLGGLEAGRVPAARERLADGYYVPLSDLVALGTDDLQRRDDIAKLYSQSTGLATFLMHADGGRQRETLAQYLDAVYSNRADEATLSRLTGMEYGELDRAYREWMEGRKSEVGESGHRVNSLIKPRPLVAPVAVQESPRAAAKAAR